jgi:hypothetical protein
MVTGSPHVPRVASPPYRPASRGSCRHGGRLRRLHRHRERPARVARGLARALRRRQSHAVDVHRHGAGSCRRRRTRGGVPLHEPYTLVQCSVVRLGGEGDGGGGGVRESRERSGAVHTGGVCLAGGRAARQGTPWRADPHLTLPLALLLRTDSCPQPRKLDHGLTL